jgi:hypothetical protein
MVAATTARSCARLIHRRRTLVRAAPQSREAIDTSGWWLNLVKKWFGLISQQAIRRGSFDSVAQLERAISRFVETWNQHAQPLVWTKTAQQIRRSIRNAKLISQTRH